MKLLIALLYLFICLTATATTVITYRSTPNAGVAIVGLAHHENTISPIVYRWSEKGFDFAVIVPTSIFVPSNVPTLLLGEEIKELKQSTEVLYVNGRDIEDYKLSIREQWINSRWLGWVMADSYPFVYSLEEGWIYIEEFGDLEFGVFRFSTTDWRYIDLSEELETYFELKP